MRERFDEVEEERKGLESELSACKRELQEYKDKLLEWCASYMEAMTRVKHVEEQYKLDRREWENDLKDTRAQRDQFKAAAESYRLDRFEEDRQWQEEKAMSILGGAAGTGKGKRDVPDHEAQEARKKLKGQGDSKWWGRSHSEFSTDSYSRAFVACPQESLSDMYFALSSYYGYTINNSRGHPLSRPMEGSNTTSFEATITIFRLSIRYLRRGIRPSTASRLDRSTTCKPPFAPRSRPSTPLGTSAAPVYQACVR